MNRRPIPHPSSEPIPNRPGVYRVHHGGVPVADVTVRSRWRRWIFRNTRPLLVNPYAPLPRNGRRISGRTKALLVILSPALFFAALGWVLVACGVAGAINMAGGSSCAVVVVATVWGLFWLAEGDTR